MKANELMIGDWVLYEGKPYQIRQLGIYGVDRDGEDYPAVCIGKPTGIGLIVERNEIEPFPLTSETLEKNGFEKVLDKYKLPNYRIKCPSNEKYYFTIWTAVDGYWSPVGFGVTLSGIPCEIDYVHQLQNALRLCGIEKEIMV